jgi:RNA polymerase sigma-70 factor (ECF subfamily)
VEVTQRERELVERARRGDRAAFGSLVELHRERAYSAALSLLRDHEEARDLSQEAFVRAFQALDRFDPARPFFPWYYRILRNRCLNHLKRHGPRRKVSLDAMCEEDHLQFEARTEDPVRSIQAEQMSRHLRAAIGRLKPEFREIIVLYHFEEMSYRDIADSLRIPIGTVMSRLFHARRALAQLMEPHR